MKTYIEHADYFEQLADFFRQHVGEIEHRLSGTEDWCQGVPHLNQSIYKYQFHAPAEQKLRPYNQQELEALVGRAIKPKMGGSSRLIGNTRNLIAETTLGGEHSPKNLLAHFLLRDLHDHELWHPCGVQEGEGGYVYFPPEESEGKE